MKTKKPDAPAVEVEDVQFTSSLADGWETSLYQPAVLCSMPIPPADNPAIRNRWYYSVTGFVADDNGEIKRFARDFALCKPSERDEVKWVGPQRIPTPDRGMLGIEIEVVLVKSGVAIAAVSGNSLALISSIEAKIVKASFATPAE